MCVPFWHSDSNKPTIKKCKTNTEIWMLTFQKELFIFIGVAMVPWFLKDSLSLDSYRCSYGHKDMVSLIPVMGERRSKDQTKLTMSSLL